MRSSEWVGFTGLRTGELL